MGVARLTLDLSGAWRLGRKSDVICARVEVGKMQINLPFFEVPVKRGRFEMEHGFQDHSCERKMTKAFSGTLAGLVGVVRRGINPGGVGAAE